MDEIPLLLTDNDEEIVIYDLILNTKNRVYNYLDKQPGVFNLEKLGDSYCFNHFRFYKEDIRQLMVQFNIPDQLVLKTRINVTGEEGLCILLRRLSYPNRYADLMSFFPRGRSALSEICNYMVDHIMREKGHILKNVNQSWMSRERKKRLYRSINSKASPYKRCFGFIDGTVRAICRPTHTQRDFYSGHKRVHAIKFQSLMLPNAIISNLFGSVIGRRHDGYLLAKSRLVRKLEQKFNGWPNPPYVYGDSGYPLRKFIMVPIKGTLNRRERKLNKTMSSLRVSVEWGFAKIIQLFPFVDFKKNLKIQKQQLSKFYKVATILTNCHTCLYGSQVCSYFECDPPGLTNI